MEHICMFVIYLLTFGAAAADLAAPGSLEQVCQDFSTDPGWDNFQNRIVGVDMPQRRQDFGWSSTHHASADGGEIGGHVENSRVMAYYAMPLGRPLTFNDALSASGKLAVTEIGLRGVAYIGFFNPLRHTWRPWSSLGFRIWQEDMLGQVMFDWMSSDWRGRGSETAILLKPDGRVHDWSFQYDPDARPAFDQSDPILLKHITDQRGNGRPYELQGEEFIFERLKQDEPDVTREQLHERLIRLRDAGLIEYFHRHNQHRWWKRDHPETSHGRVRLTFDAEIPYVIWFDAEIRQAPVELTRFGLFNICRYGTGVTIWLADLTVNGEKIELAADPHWEGRNNRACWTEPDFQAMSNFGWSQTNWAGEAPGEIGGLFWRLEPFDPLFAYYADEVGELTMEDPIEFEGRIYFTDGMTDASMFFGYFNKASFSRRFTKGDGGDADHPMSSMMGISLADVTSVGYYWNALVYGDGGDGRVDREWIFTPGPDQHRFTFRYDPKTGRAGRITYTLDGREKSFDLTPDLRRQGVQFDHFGLATVRRGGNSVEVYLDDLVYTARTDRPKVRHSQQTLETPYPKESGGRRY